jgi:DNA polymerase-3 subunit epsilon
VPDTSCAANNQSHPAPKTDEHGRQRPARHETFLRNNVMFDHFTELRLERPLVVLDLETTGIDVRKDRIVEIALLRILPDGTNECFATRVNPGVPIPAAATAVHGIRNADVAACPPMIQLVNRLDALLDGADLCGYNVKRYDLPLLMAEYRRCGREFSLGDRSIIDVLEIFRRRERRDLTTAVSFYCGRPHTGAHGAQSDVEATAAVLDAQLARYADLPRSVGRLGEQFQSPARDSSR